jgi:chromosome segregation ATPase
LLRRAAELSADLGRLNRALQAELTASGGLSESLQRELNEALKELSALRTALEAQRGLAESSQAELNAVSALLQTAGNELTSLTQLYESLLSETASQTARANRAERSVRLWRVIGIAGGIIGAGGIAVAVICR